MKLALHWGSLLIGLQLTLIVAYWLVERNRNIGTAGLSTRPPRIVDMAVPHLTLRRPDGTIEPMRSPKRPTLVHVWATWCRPCREELPALLSLPSERSVDVVAIALDEDWGDVERFLGGRDARYVVLGNSSEVERILGLTHLPVTFLLRPGGSRAIARFDGARDWSDEPFVTAYVSAR